MRVMAWIATRLHCRLLHELDTPVQLAQFVVTSARVREYFHAIETHQDVRTGALLAKHVS